MITLQEILGIPVPPGTDEDEVVKKILRDSFVQTKVMEIVIGANAQHAIEKMSPLEKKALAVRVGIQPIAKPKVEWGIIHPAASKSGKMLILATCGAETIQWSGAVRELATLKFRGESVPADIAALYRMHLGDGEDADHAQARANYESLQAAKRKQIDVENAQKKIPQY